MECCERYAPSACQIPRAANTDAAVQRDRDSGNQPRSTATNVGLAYVYGGGQLLKSSDQIRLCMGFQVLGL